MPSAAATLQSLVENLGTWSGDTAVLAFRRDDSESVTYEEIARLARRFAAQLRDHGVRRGSYVALLAPPSPRYIAAALGVLWSGGAVVPIDAQFSDEVLAHTLSDSGAVHLVTTTDRVDHLHEILPNAELRVYCLDAETGEPNCWLPDNVEERESPEPGVEEDDVAALFYTSGTTGMPKGVPLTHANLAFQLRTIRDEKLVETGARVLLPLPLHHVYPFVIGMLTPLSLGLCIVLPSAFTGPQLLRAIQEGRVTHIIGVPRLYDALLSGLRGRMKDRGAFVNLLFRTLFALSHILRRGLGLRAGKTLLGFVHKRMGPDIQVTASGGAPLAASAAWDLETLGWEVAIGYGLTETSPLLTINPPGRAKLGSVGSVVDDIKMRIASVENVPEPWGEVQVTGTGVFGGYHNLPEKTKEAFTEDGWFRTGDLGRLDDKRFLYLSGRVSTLIVMPGGENIQPDELEQAYGEHPAIEEIGVLQHDGRLVAVIVPDADVVPVTDVEAMRSALQNAVRDRGRSMPSYQRLSDFVISREALARTRIGKIQRHTLRERFETLLKAREEGEEARPGGPISWDEMSDRDRALLEMDQASRVWDWLAENYPSVRLTPDTNLQLELDIDSLEWIEITERIREIAGVELEEEAIAQVDTVRDLLTAVVEAAEEVDRAAAAPELFDDPESVLTDRQRRWLEPLPWYGIVAAWLTYQLNRALMRVFFRLRVEGLRQLPDEHPFIIAPNHASYLDPFVVAAALDFARLRDVHWGGWTGAVLTSAWRRFFTRLAQVVPIEGARAIRSSLAAGATVLKRRRSLVWFPEGMRSPSGELLEFKPGIGLLLEHFDVPVVPVYIKGTHDALPRGSTRLRLKPLAITFGTPVKRDMLREQGHGEEPHECIAQALHNEVAALRDSADHSDNFGTESAGQ